MTENEKAIMDKAVAAIYFNDSSDYETALWQIIHILDPKACELLEGGITCQQEVYKKYCE